MRLCFVVHGLPPAERGGVEQCTVALADELARRGHTVEVFAPTRRESLPDLALRRERRGGWHVTWLNLLTAPTDPASELDPPGVAEAFARFLEAERPDVVHVQHVLRLGLGILDAAAEHGAPLVYTAHDWYPLTDFFALLRPDLTRYAAVPTPAEEARADLARSILNLEPALGAYHLGVPPAWLDGEVRTRFEATLDADPVAAGFHENEWSEALERREAMATRRRAAFARVDTFVSPSAFLAGWLERGFEGLDRAPRVVHRPNGIHTARLARVPAVDAGADRLRLGFVGSLTKHKGVHLLLDAWAQLGDAERERLTLTVHGDSTDRVYVERIAKRAQELGAVYAGAFDADDLAGVLEGIDVLVVPSIWYENFPTVLREAYAAGRIAVASDLGALPESVNDGVDGLLFRPDDAQDLARVLRRLLDEEGLVARLLAGVPKVADVGDQVDGLEVLYDESVAAREAPTDPGGGLAHLTALGARYRELEALPTRELLARATGGIADLARLLGVEDDPNVLLVRGVGEASRALEELRDRRTESGYLARLVDERDRRARWLDERLDGVERETQWLRTDRDNLANAVEFHERSTKELEKERDWLRQVQSDFEREREWLQAQTESLGEERDWLASKQAELARERERLTTTLHETRTAAEKEREWRDSMVADMERERDWLRSEMRSREEERRWLASLISEKEEALTYVWQLVEGRDSDLARLRGEIEACEEVATQLLAAFGTDDAPTEGAADPPDETIGGGKLERLLGGLYDHGRALLEQLGQLRDAQTAARAELDWRRGEMEGARLALARRTVSWLRFFTGVGKRVHGWEPLGGPVDGQRDEGGSA